MWLNLAKITLEEDFTSTYLANGNLETINIPAMLFEGSSFKVGVMASSKDEVYMRELQQISMQAYARGQLSLEGLLNTYRIENLRELERKVKEYTAKAEEANALAEQNKMAAELEMQKQKAQFENEYKVIIAKQEAELKAMELRLKEAELALRQKEVAGKLASEEADREVKKMDILAEQQSEMGYLAEQSRAAKTQEMLKAIELMIEAYTGNKKVSDEIVSQLRPRKPVKEQIKR